MSSTTENITNRSPSSGMNLTLEEERANDLLNKRDAKSPVEIVPAERTPNQELINELVFQNDEKEKRAAELIIANQELAFQNDEKEKRAAEPKVWNDSVAAGVSVFLPKPFTAPQIRMMLKMLDNPTA